MTERDPYAFETFPRGDLSLPISRRQALLTAFTESKVRDSQSRGVNAFKLSALGTMPDELLALMTPRPVTGCRLAEQDGVIVAYLPRADRPVTLFPADSPAMSVYRRFDGQTMIEVMAREMAADREWEQNKAFGYVRGVFLHLITLGVCWPK